MQKSIILSSVTQKTATYDRSHTLADGSGMGTPRIASSDIEGEVENYTHYDQFINENSSGAPRKSNEFFVHSSPGDMTKSFVLKAHLDGGDKTIYHGDQGGFATQHTLY